MTSIAEQVGRVVGGRYRLLAPVGAGASSHVYAAIDTRLGRRVAVKMLHPSLAVDAAFLRRFQAEARLAASLDHPHIMRVFDWGEEAAGPYLVLEFLGGGSLRALLDTGLLLSHPQAASIGSQAAAGLAYAHRRGIVHRDIKPGNLLFDEEGHLRIADFGVARALAESALTEPLGAMFGTARYASPEQAEGRPLDDRTDVYSLALVLYEALTGRVPFARETIPGTLMARVGATLPPAAELGPLTPILAQAAISEPFARLAAASVASDLELLSRQLPPPAPIPLDRIKIGRSESEWVGRDPTNLQPAGPVDDLTLFGRPFGEAPAASMLPEGPGRAAPPGEVPGGDALPALPAGAGYGESVSGRDGADRAVAGAGGTPLYWPSANGGAVTDTLALAGLADVSARPAEAAAPRRAPVDLAGVRSSAPELGEPASTGRRRRRRLWPWVVAVAVLLVAAGVGTLAVMRYDVYAPVVPNLEGKPLSAAEGAARHAGLVVKKTVSRYDAAVPAGRVIWQSIGQGRHERRGTVIDVTVSRGARPVPVPSLAGKSIAAAEAALRASHLSPGAVVYEHTMTVRRGAVISWSDMGRDEVPGTKVGLVVSSGPPFERVGNLKALPYAQAAAALEKEHLKPVREGGYSHVARGAVISTSPSAGQLVREGSRVIVDVSLGPPMTTVPSLIGQSVGAAEQLLANHDLHVVTIYGPSEGIVLYSSPPAGARVVQGSDVALWVL